MVAERALEQDEPRWRAALAGRVRDDSLEQRLGQIAPADGEHGAQLSALGPSLVLGSLPASDVDFEPAPAEGTPEKRLHHPDRLHAAGPDRLCGRRDQAAAQPQPVGRFGDREPVGAVEPAPEAGHGRECVDDASAAHAARRARRDDGDRNECTEHGCREQPDAAEEDRGDQPRRRNREQHALLVGLGRFLDAPLPEREQLPPQPVGFARRQVGETRVAPGRAGHPQA